jgi:hypothetical protein
MERGNWSAVKRPSPQLSNCKPPSSQLGFQRVTERTGLGCPRWRQPVATIVDEAAGTVILRCPRCEYRWSTDHAATKEH